MKIGELELVTTAGEIDELYDELKTDISPVVVAREVREIFESSQMWFNHCKHLTEITEENITDSSVAFVKGWLLGASVYHRRLIEVGNRVMQGATVDDLAFCAALEVRERETDAYRKALARIERLEAEADGCVGVVDYPHTKALRAASKVARDALAGKRATGASGSDNREREVATERAGGTKRLMARLEVEYCVTCETCDTTDSAFGDNWTASGVLYKAGWRVVKGQVVCEECRGESERKEKAI